VRRDALKAVPCHDRLKKAVPYRDLRAPSSPRNSGVGPNVGCRSGPASIPICAVELIGPGLSVRCIIACEKEAAGLPAAEAYGAGAP